MSLRTSASTASISVLAHCALAASALAQPRITSLGVLPGNFLSGGVAVNNGGTIAVGSSEDFQSGERAVRWTLSGGLQSLGLLPGHGRSGSAAMSSDGAVVVGTSNSPNADRAFRWTEAGGLQSLGTLPGGGSSFGLGVSADGSVVVGVAFEPAARGVAFRWTSATGIQSICPQNSGAAGISADGSTVVGTVSTLTSNRAFRWTAAGGVQYLGELPGDSDSYGNAANADGSVIVGRRGLAPDFTESAFRWTAIGGIQDLGLLSGDDVSEATAVSADGTRIFGYSGNNTTRAVRSFMWTPAGGMVNLSTYLQTLGLDLTGWQLDAVSGVSPDGSAITGNGAFNGEPRGFVISGLSTPACAADFNGDGISVQDLFDFLNAWFSNDPRADFCRDGQVGVQDIFDFLNAWFAGC